MPEHDRIAVPLKAKLVFVFVVGFVAVQILVPAVQLAAPRSARFGWQMYAVIPATPTFWTVAGDGEVRPVDLNQHVGYVRGDLDYLPWLPDYLCRSVPDTIAVGYQAIRSSTTEEFQCP